MSDGLNRVTLLGSLGADGELRFTTGGQAVLNLRLATSSSYLDKDKVRKERTDWHSCVLWGKRGESLAQYLTKGKQVYVEGSLQTSSYEDKEGQKRYKTEVKVDNIILCGKGGDGERFDTPRASGVVSQAPSRGFGGAKDAPPDDFNYGSSDDVPF